MKYRLLILSVLIFSISACTTISPIPLDNDLLQTQNFSHQDFDRVLNQHVDSQGRVDYQRLQENPKQFERYYQQIANYSPDSHQALFNTPTDRLAYWLNAYNAAVIKTVLHYYPINSIEEVKPPIALFFLPDKTGFFVFQKPIFGGVSTSLYYLENSVVRERFTDPRIHFALNCASRGCPKLPNYAFQGDQLNQQLDFEARKFFSESRNFRIDHTQKTIFLSSILDWYEDDFIDWYEQQYPQGEATLINYVRLYLAEERLKQFDDIKDYEVQFTTYDWRLNDQNAK